VDALEQSAPPDAHSTTSLLWALLALRQHAHAALPVVVGAARRLNPLGLLPSQLCRLMEAALMLQLEAPTLGASLPPELLGRARAAWQATQQATHATPPPQLLAVSQALDALGLAHGVQVFNNYIIDAVVPQEATRASPLAILLHPPKHYTSGRALVGSVQLRARLLAKLGFAVVDISHETWDGLPSDDVRVQSLRELLQPHIKGAEAAAQ